MLDAGGASGRRSNAAIASGGMPASAPPNRPRTGALDLARDVDRGRRVVAAVARPASRRSRSRRRGRARASAQERQPAAEAEADREQRARPAPSSDRTAAGGRPDVGGDPGPRRLRDVRHVLEGVVAGVSRPAVRPNQSIASGVDAVLGEPQGELLVVGMEPADVGQDHDPGPGRLAWRGPGTPGSGCRRRPSASARLESSAPPAIGAIGGRLSRSKHIGRSSARSWPPTVRRTRRRCRAGAAGGPRDAGGRMPRRCLPAAPSSSRSSAARPSPTPTGSSASPAGSRASARPATTSSSSCRRWATPPTSCSASPPRSPTSPTRASSTSSSRPASTRARRSCRWRSTRSASPAISLTGPQAGITTDGRYGRARIAGDRAAPASAGARRRQGRHRRRLPGPERARPRTTTRSRRSAAAAATRPRSPSPPASAPTAARSSPTSAASTPPTRASSPDARQLAGHRLRGDARARPPGRPGHAGPGRRARLGQRRRHRGPQLVRGRAGHAHQGGPARGAAQQGPRPRPRPERRQGHARRRAGPAGRRPRRSSSRSPRPASTST